MALEDDIRGMFHEEIISFVLFPPDSVWLSAVKIVFAVFSLFLIAAIFFLLLKSSWLKARALFDIFEFFTYRPYGAKKATKQWLKISARLNTPLESEYKLAVIEADSMFDDTLKRMNYGGDSLLERLEKVPQDILPDVEKVRLAHKVRNNIVHDPDYRLGLEEAKSALLSYEKALIDLGIL